MSHNGEDIGNVWGMNHGDAIEPHANALPIKHRGRGLGNAMYDALYAHVFHNGIKQVRGGGHTPEASRVHQSLARRHGIDYKPVVEDPDSEYPHAPYSYSLKRELSPSQATIKSEGLLQAARLAMALDALQRPRKAGESWPAIPWNPPAPNAPQGLGKAISDLKVGENQGDRYDYSHLLTPLHRASGYKLHVFHNSTPGHDMPLRAAVIHRNEEVGDLVCLNRGGALEPHANIDSPHNGKGLGRRMYEAALAHAYHVGGFKTVAGSHHSPDAALVHESLANRHGLSYKKTPTPDPGAKVRGLVHGPYKYDLT